MDISPNDLLFIFTMVLSPFLTTLLKKLAPEALDGLAVPINQLVAILLFGLVGWAMGGDAGATSWLEFILKAVAAGAIGSSAISARRKVGESGAQSGQSGGKTGPGTYPRRP